MNGPSSRALREGGIGGSLPYKIGFTLVVRPKEGGAFPQEWLRKTSLQGAFGDYGQVLRIDIQQSQGCAYVEYEDVRDAEDAGRELDNKPIAGKAASVQMAGQSNLRRPGSNLAPLGPPGRPVDIEGRVAELAQRHFLDEAAAARLASVFQERSRIGCDLVRDFQELDEHLAASNKPSALVSMKLAELRSGRTIGPCRYKGGGRRQIGEDLEDATASRPHGRDSYDSSMYFGEASDGGSCDGGGGERGRRPRSDRRSPRHSRERDRRRSRSRGRRK
eukprot:TRINITY_DN92066_c0_g1_i1.p1 TRINITY_DN92066_c0_g1~~TRINITY_DN92066_c0_g1_i1.p1  ORF type:complete len:276 (-),score=41.25 TRINITY_DN92066_c0_g1_i1:155-982(-)